jgi:murein DD-endopeptidase MepM/ murein hydrolase activator NlpD
MKKILAIIFLLFGFSLGAQTVPFAVIPENPRPGEPVTVGIGGSSGAKTAALMFDGKRLARAAFFAVPREGSDPPFWAAVLAVPSTAKPGKAVIVVQSSPQSVIVEIPLEIADREFDSEVIPLNPVLTGIRTDPDPQKTAESNHLWSILSKTGNEAYYFAAFIPPVTSTRRTSAFGDRRVYRYSNGSSDTSIHAGIDYGIPMGTEVRACGAGKVVLARNRIVTGNSVILEHLPGVYSLYYHLDKIEVSEGSLVAVGSRLGLSGATGLATGPHLHWEIRVSGENTDPDAFIGRPLLDKNAIIGKIY